MQFGKLSSPRAAFTMDVGLRYQAYGWHVRHVDDGEDLAAVDRALAAAQAETGRPSLIVLRPISGGPRRTSRTPAAPTASCGSTPRCRVPGWLCG